MVQNIDQAAVDENGTATERPKFQHRTMEQIVADYLRMAILAGRLGPGDRVPQEEIARQMGVSGIPVREALRRLHSEGLVELRPHRGAVVVSLRPEDIVEVFDIRATLEARAAELAAPLLSEEALVRLREVYQEMDALLSAWSHERWLALNRELHRTIYQACGRPRLCALIEAQVNALVPYQRAASGIVERKLPGHREHYRILIAAEARDGELLAKRTADHLRSTALDIVGYLSAHRLPLEPEVPVLPLSRS